MMAARSIVQLLIVFALARSGWAQVALDRTVLPIPEPRPPVITELDARNVKAPPRFDVRAPKGALNVVIVLLDDMGFGQSSADSICTCGASRPGRWSGPSPNGTTRAVA
jgi:arylsulfatase